MAGVDYSSEGHHVINTFIDDIFVDSFCATPYLKDPKTDGSSSQADPIVSATLIASTTPTFDPLVAHQYYSAMFEANHRSHIFIHDVMQYQYKNMFVTPEERTFLTRESYFTYYGWSESNPYHVGGTSTCAAQADESE